MFDLHLLPIKITAGVEQPEQPGVFYSAPPRRRDRSRSGDYMVALFVSGGSADLPDSAAQVLLEEMADAYYRSRGTVTSGLRHAVEVLNEALLKQNLRRKDDGQVMAALQVAVQRRDTLYLAQAGSTRSLFISKEGITRPDESSATGTPLGIGHGFQVHLSQVQLQPGDVLLLAPGLHGAELIALQNSKVRPSLEHVRRSLSGRGLEVLDALIVQYQAGSGQIQTLKTRPAEKPAEAAASPEPETIRREVPVETPVEPPPARDEPGTQPQPVETDSAGLDWTLPQSPQPSEPPEMEDIPKGEPQPSSPDPAPSWRKPSQMPIEQVVQAVYLGKPETLPEHLRQVEDPQPPEVEEPQAVVESTPPAPLIPPIRLNLRKKLASLWLAGRSARRKLDQNSQMAVERVLPSSPERGSGLSTLNMLFLAIAVPVIVVAITFTVYLYAPGGRSEQHYVFLNQAEDFADQAAEEEDITLRRNSWNQVLYWLDQANEYGQSDEADALRRRAQDSLDGMDRVDRVIFQPATGAHLGDSVNVTQLVATTSDIYALDSNAGRALRLTRASSGYELDASFECGPGEQGDFTIHPLVEILLLPAKNQFETRLMAVDQTGQLVYCKSGEAPEVTRPPVPDTGWGEISAASLDNDVLHILDKLNNRIWLYVGDDSSFSEGPRLYFDNEVPRLDDVTDIAVNGEDLFLLHSDSTVTKCQFRSSSFSQTRCTEPAPFGDDREGRESNPVSFLDAAFVQAQVVRLFAPTLYLLDTANNAVYQMTVLLNFQRQYRPDDASYPLPNREVTAFTVIEEPMSRQVMLAFGNIVYFGSATY